MEETLPRLGRLVRRLRKFNLIYDCLAGYTAALRAIRAGASSIIVGTYHNCGLLPRKRGVRYFLLGDATMQQLKDLGYNKEKGKISKLASCIYGQGIGSLAREGHQFFCISRWYADALQAEHAVRPDQITLVPFCVDTTYWIPKEGERRPGPLRVVFIGADFMRKGGDVLMQVVDMPQFAPVEWHLVTKSPPQMQRANVKCYTRFNTDSNELRNLVQDCDVAVLPTRSDCSPMATLEAAACGIPNIITRIAGTPELVDDGVNGLLLEAPTANHLAQALEVYAASPSLLRLHGAAARAKMVREFDTRVVMGIIRGAMLAGKHGNPQAACVSCSEVADKHA